MVKNKITALLLSVTLFVGVVYAAVLCCHFGSAENAAAGETSTFEVMGSGAAVEYVENDTYGPTGEYEYRTTLKQGDVLKYNEPVDLREADEEFFRFRLLPKTIGETDVQIISVTLTDAYDSSNYVRLTGTYDGNPGGGAYWKVGSAEQPQVGYEAWNNMIHVDNQYGAWTSTYFGAPDSAGGQILLFYNDTEKSFYVSSAYADSVVCFICDLDDGKYYSELWNGFTTGEVYISVTVQQYAEGKSETDVAVISAAGNKLDGYTTISDTSEPDIVVNYTPFADGELPEGTVGYPYPVFPAVAYDAFSGILDTDIKVYGTDKEEIEVSNGKFSVKKAGRYFIEYTVADEAGNRAEKIVEIVMVNTINEIRFVAETEEARTSTVGERICLDSVSVTGGTGELVRNIGVKDPQGRFCKLEGLSFVPESEGTYTVSYVAQDIFSQKAVYRYEIEVSQPSGSSVLLKQNLPSVFLSGYTYTLPEAIAKNYTTGSAEAVTISVKEGEEVISLSDGKYRPDGDEGEVTVIYSTASTKKEFTVPVVNIWKDAEQSAIDISQYFLADGFAKELTKDNISFTSESSASVTFVNSLLMRGFYAGIELSGTDRFEIVFEDSALYGCKVTVVFENTDSGVKISIGGKTVTTVSGSLTGLTQIKMTEDGKSLSVFGVQIPFSVYDNGIAFDGFSGDLARITFRIQDEDGGIFAIKQLNQQFISSEILYDMVRPTISLHSSYGGSFLLGEKYTICAAGIADELDPTVRTSVSVLKPDGNYAVAADGTVLNGASVDRDYEITLDQYGSYYVTYSAAVDGIWGNSFEYVMKAVDTTAPEIVIDADSTQTKAAVGSEVKIPSATVTDNLSDAENIKLTVYIQAPNGKFTLCEDDSFTPDQKGVYLLRYFAFDEEGNICVKDYEVIVE